MLRVGVDVASVARVARLVNRPRFVAWVYTAREQRDCAGHPQRWAARWAAKEAVRKLAGAVHRSLPAYRDIEVANGPTGAPWVSVRGDAVPISLSLTHDGGVAVAVAVADEWPAPDLASMPDIRLPERPSAAHKGTFGTAVVLAGAVGFSGAPQLAALGAARAGAGLVQAFVPHSIYPIVAGRCAAIISVPLPDGDGGILGPDAVAAFLDASTDRWAVVVVGCGIGRSGPTRQAVATLLSAARWPLVVDADALTIVAEDGLPWPRNVPVIITPHPAEMARLAGTTTAVVQNARAATARAYARSHGITVVLKGEHTVIAGPDGRVISDPHEGVVALATGGTGDVLAGVVGGFVAQGLNDIDAAAAAVAVHIEAGLDVQRRRGRAGSIADDLVDALPAAQEHIRRALEGRRQ